MVVRAAVHGFQVHVRARPPGEAVEEVLDQLALQVADQLGFHLGFDLAGDAPTQVHRRDAERFIHRHQEVARAVDAFLVAQGLVERFAERDADVLDGVVLIHIQIALAGEIQVERAVPCEQLQHVVEKPDARRDAVLALALDREPERDLGFGRIAVERGSALGFGFRARRCFRGGALRRLLGRHVLF